MSAEAELPVAHPLLQEILGGARCPVDEAPKTDPTKISELIAIVFYGRSGTTLMGHLLDSHPNLLSIVNREFRQFFKLFSEVEEQPAEAQLAWFLALYCVRQERDSDVEQRFVKLSDGSVSHIPADIGFVLDRDAPGWPPALPVLVRKFLSHTLHCKGVPSKVSLNAREFFQVFHTAYNAACGRDVGDDVRAIVWAMHVPDAGVIEMVAPMFDGLKVIHCIRRPTQTLGSHFKRYHNPLSYHPTGELSPERTALHVLRMLLTHDQRLSSLPNVDEFGVRLEDLHNNPERTTSRLAARLGVPVCSSLMEATYFGEPYVYKARDRVIRTFDPGNLENQHLELYENRDLFLLENLLAENYRKWGYEFLTQAFPDEVRENGLKMLALEPLKIELLCWDKARGEGVSEEQIEDLKLMMRALLYQRIEQPPEIFDLL